MKALPIVIAVLAAGALVRWRLRRRGAGGAPRQESREQTAARLERFNFLGDTGLVAGREIKERLRGRFFWVVTVILFVVVAAAVVIPTVHKQTSKTAKVGVVAGSAALETQMHALAESLGLSIELVDEPSLTQARAALASGRLDMAAEGMTRLLVKDPLSPTDTSPAARYVRALSVTLGSQQAFAAAGLTSTQASILAGAKPLPIESLHPAKKTRTTAQATALLGVILVFIVLTQYLTWTLMGVMEEKASRVIEVLLATVRPLQLLAGKVMGIGAVALTQAVVLAAFALVLAEAVGSNLVHGAAPLVLAAALAWLILGYAFYSWVYAAAGSLAERQDQVQSLALPLSAPMIFGYIVSLTTAGSGRASLLVEILAYLPPTAPFAMPTLTGLGAVTWWQFLLAVTASSAGTVIVALLAARVYRTAVLRTGGRVSLRGLVGDHRHRTG